MRYLHKDILFSVGTFYRDRLDPIPFAWKMVDFSWIDKKQWEKYKASLPKIEKQKPAPAAAVQKINIHREPVAKKAAPIKQQTLF